MPTDPTQRFSDRVTNYVKYRPSYPTALLDDLAARIPTGATIADIGSGTGIFSKLLLERGFEVHAVEPNDAMREYAESDLGAHPKFHSHNGRAEATGLADRSVDAITCAQAFHWFATVEAAKEFQRILKPGGLMALVWNERILSGDPFSERYEALLLKYATDYTEVRHENTTPELMAKLFPGFEVSSASYDNYQDLDWDGLKGRVESSSYVPTPDHPNYVPLMEALEKLFVDVARDGCVRMGYLTQAYWME
jgi:ubiquinone/menaquinone biosynthesis C-methylase UbiE